MDQHEQAAARPLNSRAALWAAIITSVAGFMAALDNRVVTTARPTIHDDLGGALEDLEWTVSAHTRATCGRE